MSAIADRKGNEIYEFGPFRVDAGKEILLREGESVALTPKAFQVLLALVRGDGQLVTKDDLMKTVWPDSFVEEANLSRNIFMLRKALGESPEDHRYIVTVPGRGYRLAESVRLASEPDATLVVAGRSEVEIHVKETRPWLRTAIAAAAVLLIAVGAVVIRKMTYRSGALTTQDAIVLSEFTNSTGDPVFDGILRQGIAVQLEQSPVLSLVSDQRIRHTLTLMGQRPDTRLTPDLARQVCARIGSAVAVDGSIARVGSQYVLSLHAADCATGETLDDEQVQVARKEDVLNALTRISGNFRARAGESLAAIQQHAKPLPEAVTPSLEALQAYSAALKVAFSSPQDAILLLQRATRIDSGFAAAYALQGRFYADVFEPTLSQSSIAKAYELRDRASDRERFLIEANYQEQVTGDLEKTQEICELWAQVYPRDAVPHGELTWISQAFGRYDKSIDEARKAIAIDPDFTPGYNNLAWAYVLSGRSGGAENTLQQASQRHLEMPEMLVMRYYIAFLKGDADGMRRAVAQSRGQFGAEDWATYEQASVLADSGRLKEARETWNRAVALALQANQRDRAAMYEAGAAVREAFWGNSAEARLEAIAARKLSNDRDVEWGAALALALSGNLPQAEQLADDLEKRFPADTYVHLSYAPTLRALFALHDRDPAKALEQLQAAAPFELGVPGSWSGFFGNLYIVYVRGMAYLARRQGPEAAAEFQKVIDHPAIVFTDPVGPAARLELARAYALSGDKARAGSVYRDLLNQWSHADPEIPTVSEAKREYAEIAQQDRSFCSEHGRAPRPLRFRSVGFGAPAVHFPNRGKPASRNRDAVNVPANARYCVRVFLRAEQRVDFSR
jgi:eukaryotic-like serine/threonine-protein kinase